MTKSIEERPQPGEHIEISRGSGPAAILMFLHIAVTGYLGSIIYYLIKGNIHVYWTLVPFSASLYYYFPAAFALVTSIPTNSLTRTVSRVAQAAGVLALLAYGGGLMVAGFFAKTEGFIPGIITACAVVAGVVGALLVRVLFRMGIVQTVENEKNSSENGVPE